MARRPKSYDELATEVILGSGKHEVAPIQEVEMDIVWVDGQPTLRSVPRNISLDPVKGLKELLKVSLDMPYSGPDQSLKGKSNGEAIVLNLIRQAANGNPAARSEVLDRFLGTPTQNIQQTTITGDLTGLLERVADDMRQAQPVTIIDAETNDDSNSDKTAAGNRFEEVDDL